MIKVRYHADIDEIRQVEGSDWIDLRCAEDVTMRAGEYRLISLGVSIELPKGYEAIIAPRSSTPSKHNIICANSIGIIDESYCGDDDIWRFPAYAIGDTRIPANTRICQFRLIRHMPRFEIRTVPTLRNPNRGGIGSTG